MRPLFASSLLAIALAGCATAPASSPEATVTTPQESAWPALRDSFIEGYFQHFPTYAVYQGRHEFDGRLPDISPAGLAAREAFLRDAIARGQALTGLAPVERIERDQMILVARNDLFELTDEDQPHRNPRYYLNLIDPSVYVTRPYAPPATRLDAFIAHTRNIPAFVQQIEAAVAGLTGLKG